MRDTHRRHLDASRVVGVVIAAIAMMAPSLAHAEEVAPAEHLFQEARALVDEGNYAAACPKLEASQKLEPALGTQFNLADCYEHVGRTASAYALFGQVASIARTAGKFDRERSARAREAALEPRLARVRLLVTSPAPGQELRIDDAPVDKTATAAAMPVDPGAHRLRASAPDRTSWEGTFVATAGQSLESVVPALVDPRPRPEVVAAAPAPASSRKTSAIIAAGVGVVSVTVGVVAGLVAMSKRSDAERECPKDTFAFRCPTTAGEGAWNSAAMAGNVSTLGFVVGAAAGATAGILWYTLPSRRARAGIVPTGVLVQGSF